MVDKDIQDAARRLKAYFLQLKRVDWAAAEDARVLAVACQLGTCGGEPIDSDEISEEDKQKEIEKRSNALTRALREHDHDLIVIYRLQQLIEAT